MLYYCCYHHYLLEIKATGKIIDENKVREGILKNSQGLLSKFEECAFISIYVHSNAL